MAGVNSRRFKWTMTGISLIVAILTLILPIVWWMASHLLPMVVDAHDDTRYVQLGGQPNTGYVTQRDYEKDRDADSRERDQEKRELDNTLSQHGDWFKAIWSELHEQNQLLYQQKNTSAFPKDPPGYARQPPTQDQ